MRPMPSLRQVRFEGCPDEEAVEVVQLGRGTIAGNCLPVLDEIKSFLAVSAADSAKDAVYFAHPCSYNLNAIPVEDTARAELHKFVTKR